jgi:hypothetical protein
MTQSTLRAGPDLALVAGVAAIVAEQIQLLKALLTELAAHEANEATPRSPTTSRN